MLHAKDDYAFVLLRIVIKVAEWLWKVCLTQSNQQWSARDDYAFRVACGKVKR